MTQLAALDVGPQGGWVSLSLKVRDWPAATTRNYRLLKISATNISDSVQVPGKCLRQSFETGPVLVGKGENVSGFSAITSFSGFHSDLTGLTGFIVRFLLSQTHLIPPQITSVTSKWNQEMICPTPHIWIISIRAWTYLRFTCLL